MSTKISVGLLTLAGLLGATVPSPAGDRHSNNNRTAAHPGFRLVGAQPNANTSGEDLGEDTIQIETPDFRLKLARSSQTAAALSPNSDPKFDFTPSDRLQARSANGFHHLGDLTLRVRHGASGEWLDCATDKSRVPVNPLPARGATLAAADLTPTLPSNCPLKITRSWLLQGGRLVLRFDLRNETAEPVQIGALGIPMIFNNIISDRNLEQAHEICSFFDPYIGQDAGYLQVTRLSGHGPALVVTPYGRTPFEAYMPLREPMYPNQTFEGAFAWMAHSAAYAENEWKSAKPWNPPTMEEIAPGKSRSYGVRFLLSPTIRDIEKTLARNGRPVAVGIPGYVVPMRSSARLLLRYARPVSSFVSDPPGALLVRPSEPARSPKWRQYAVEGRQWGRARLTVTYADGLKQSISYYVTKPAREVVADFGSFLFTRQWFVDPNDPFHRSPSVMSYDRQANRIVDQDSRVWIAGLGDEGGSGSWLAAGMKQFGQPDRAEIAKYEQFVDTVLWGGIQYKDGPDKYGVRKSMLFYEPKEAPGYPYRKDLNWTSWTSWNKRDAGSVGRAYNYPHVAAVYWALYRAARNHPGIVKNHPWDWYLEQAYHTVDFLTSVNSDGSPRVGYLDVGLMEGDIFVLILQDLKREAEAGPRWKQMAATLEARMRLRADKWNRNPYPFGSEMAWDSTGQEEVYAWCKYFGYNAKAVVSLNSILGYMPTLPHWGYNGNARRYWDFLYGGKQTRIERQLHHYGSGLNAIPMLAEYRDHPDDYYLLRVGYGGMMGPLTNIDQEGFASAAFHSFPSTLAWDAYSGDYGPNFFGHVVNTGAYLIDHPEFGLQAFGGELKTQGATVTVRPQDSLRQRVYLAPFGLWLTLDAGTFEAVHFDSRTGRVRVELAAASAYTAVARLRVEQPAKRPGTGRYRLIGGFRHEREAYTIPLGTGVRQVELRP